MAVLLEYFVIVVLFLLLESRKKTSGSWTWEVSFGPNLIYNLENVGGDLKLVFVKESDE